MFMVALLTIAKIWKQPSSVGFSHSCPTLCNPMDCSTPGFPVHHQLLAITQTHVHRVGDVIQPTHPLSSPSLPPSIFPSIRVFFNESALPSRWPKYWSFSFNICPSNEYSGLISFRMDWWDLLAAQGTLKSLLWMLGAGALGRPRGMEWGGRREEGSGWRTHVYLWRIHFDIWQN